MANTRSAEKQERQAAKSRIRNKASKTRLRTQMKQMRAAIEQGSEPEVRTALSETYSVIDKSAKTGLIKANTADRYKGRLAAAAKRATAK